jgi:protein-tyrosine phosphatase
VEKVIETPIGPCSVSRARNDDVPVVVRLRDEAARWLIGRGIEQWGPGELPVSWFEQLVQEGSVWLMRTDQRILATVSLTWEDPFVWGEREGPSGYIHTLVIDRRFAGLGLGRRLLAWTERQIASSGRELARLDCVLSNRKLRSYYEQAGYCHVGHKTFPDVGWAHETALYEKHIGRLR